MWPTWNYDDTRVAIANGTCLDRRATSLFIAEEGEADEYDEHLGVPFTGAITSAAGMHQLGGLFVLRRYINSRPMPARPVARPWGRFGDLRKPSSKGTGTETFEFFACAGSETRERFTECFDPPLAEITRSPRRCRPLP